MNSNDYATYNLVSINLANTVQHTKFGLKFGLLDGETCITLSVICLDMVLACDGQTDGRTAPLVASRILHSLLR